MGTGITCDIPSPTMVGIERGRLGGVVSSGAPTGGASSGCTPSAHPTALTSNTLASNL